jgi:DNA-binding NarL/FixJ family response regulator
VQLAPKEMATLRLLAQGKANNEIASDLHVSERTVKTHLAHLFEKLGVTSHVEAVKAAARRGLVRVD